MPDKEQFPLADLIAGLGREIREAQRRASGDDKKDLFKLKECEVEVGINWSKTGSGGVEFWVVKLGGEVTKENTQTIKVALEPLGDIPLDMR